MEHDNTGLNATGSMFRGLFFAYTSMHYSSKAVTMTALLVPLAAIGVPVFGAGYTVNSLYFYLTNYA